MFSLFDGAKSCDTLCQINESLNDSTSQLYNKAKLTDDVDYSPFMCFDLSNPGAVPPSLFSSPANSLDKLVLDNAYLSELHEFLLADGASATTGMPVEYADWPVMVDISANRLDAISAYSEGRALLEKSSFINQLYDSIITHFIPLDREKPSGFDSKLFRGVVFRTFPKNGSGLLAAFQMAHGLGHHVALMLESVDDIYVGDKKAIIQYSVRKDTRSIHHSFVSAIALAFMAKLASDIYGARNKYFIADEHVRGYSEYLPDAVTMAVSSIKSSSCQLTDFGNSILSELESLNTTL